MNLQKIDFLAEDNVCGQTLLRLVSRGSAIVAELLRLSGHVPAVFLSGPEGIEDQRKYADVLHDFSYLKNADHVEEKIQRNPDLIDLDEEFRETHIVMLERFYVLFESIFKYIQDYIKYLEEVSDGVFIQHTIEGILMNQDGRQLLIEALYLYGVMLLLMDQKMEGTARERILISYYRYKGQSTIPNIDEVCKLCRGTGYAKDGKRVVGYPEEYFARIPCPKETIKLFIGRLRTDDIYSAISSYPSPEHRSTALANQASMLYVLLYFLPEMLIKEQAVMREIVDKHFADNWIICYYMGSTVDLMNDWTPYKAAKAALANTVTNENIKDLQVRHKEKLKRLIGEVKNYLTEGILTEEYVLDHIPQLLNCLRNCNVTIRWLMLHRTSDNKKIRELFNSTIDLDQLLMLLLSTAQFEFVLKNMFKSLLSSKQQRWNESKRQSSERMVELADFFSGQKMLTRVTKDEHLQAWFTDIASQINSLDYNDSTLAGRKIQQLIQALEEVEQFHQIETSLQIKQFLADARAFLHHMIRIVNVKEEVLFNISIISDLSYAWEIINEYLELMQQRIKTDPSCVLLLRATFLKLASILDLPLVRIHQANSPDLLSVTEYYSGELVDFVRRVLQIIPVTMFAILEEIIALQTNTVKETPLRVTKTELKDYAQLDHRYTLAKLTHDASVFTEGILAMETTLVGIVEVDPKQLLEDGIRKELVRKIAVAMDTLMVFKKGLVTDFEGRLEKLAEKLDGFRRSFEYIQDFVNMYGLKIWQEEFSRIVNYSVEMEANSFLKKKIYDWQSQYQSVAIPIPKFKPVDSSVNFTGRLVRELLSLSDVRKTVFVEAMSGWLDAYGKEVVGIWTFSLLQRSISVFGLSGIDKLLSFMIVSHLQSFVKVFRRDLEDGTRQFMEAFARELHPISKLPEKAAKLYLAGMQRIARVQGLFLDYTTKVGQMQLLRSQIANELNFTAKLDSNLLACALDNLNSSILQDIRLHYQDPENHPYPESDNPLLPEMVKYLENVGINTPITKIYITSEPLDHFPLIMFLFVISQLMKLTWDPKFGTLVRKSRQEPIDGAPFIVGVITILKQFHASHTQTFLAYLGQYVRGIINVTFSKDSKPTDLPQEILNVLMFLEDFCRFAHLPRKIIHAYIPSYIFDRFRH